MTDLICCRDCGSPSCRGCNVKTLDDLLESGALDKFMGEHYTIRKEKIVNTVPVVHGEWKEEFDKLRLWRGWKCSRCSCSVYQMTYEPYEYCPNCGAKMDGVTDTNDSSKK